MGSAEELPQVFCRVEEWVGLVEKIFQGAQQKIVASELGTDCETLDIKLATSQKDARLLRSIFKDIAPSAETSRLDRYKAAVLEKGKDSLEVVLSRLVEATNESIEAGLFETTVEQRMALLDAEDELSELPPSVASNENANISYVGGGNMFNNSERGTQNNNTSSGVQYIAKSITNGTLPKK